MAVGEIISAARYNAMQSKIAQVLGIGTGNFGYGQSLASAQLAISNTVNATHMQKLKADTINAYQHQNNSNPTMADVAVSADITDAVYVQYEAVINTVYANKLTYDVNQVTAPESKVSSLRTTEWGGGGDPQTIIHEFTVTFTNVNHFRNFFNSGGEVRMRATLTNGASDNTKYVEWQSMLTSVNILTMNYLNSTASSGTSFTVGAYDLTTAFKTLWTKSGSGVYNDNLITYKAKLVSNVMTFRIEYFDGTPLPGIEPGTSGTDERVIGKFTSIVEQQRATGSYVEVATPLYANTVVLG